MLRKPDEWVAAGQSGGGLGCRILRLGLAIYLTPVILAVMSIGGLAVMSAKLGEFAGRVFPDRAATLKPIPVLRRGKPGEDGQAHHLAGRPGRSRVF